MAKLPDHGDVIRFTVAPTYATPGESYLVELSGKRTVRLVRAATAGTPAESSTYETPATMARAEWETFGNVAATVKGRVWARFPAGDSALNDGRCAWLLVPLDHHTRQPLL